LNEWFKQTENTFVQKKQKPGEELLSYLNATLRHEVINTANIITGHPNLALPEHDSKETVTDSAEMSKSHTQEMETLSMYVCHDRPPAARLRQKRSM
jgi:hypothetical protein